MNRPAIWVVALGVFLAIAVTAHILWSTSAESGTVVAGTVSEVESQQVIYLPEPGIHVVATDDGFLALGDDSRHVGDRVLFCSLDDTFSAPHGERFDLQGRYLGGPAQGDMGRYPVIVGSGEVVVDVSADPELPPRSATGIPVEGPTPCGGSEDPPGFYGNSADGSGSTVSETTVTSPNTTTTVPEVGSVVGVWGLESITVDGEPMALPPNLGGEYPDVAAWIRFDEAGNVDGQMPCNLFNGEYEQQQSSIEWEVVRGASLCVEEAIMEAEAPMVALLSTPGVQVEIEGEILELAGSAVVMTYRPLEG